MSTRYYTLVDKEPVLTSIENLPVQNLIQKIRKTEFSDKWLISTVFLGVDHSFTEEGPPLVFETMIFKNYADQYSRRSSTYQEALEEHRKAIQWLHSNCYPGAVIDDFLRKDLSIETEYKSRWELI